MTKQDKPMPPDQRVRVVEQLRKFMAEDKCWKLSDVYHETCVPLGTLQGWVARGHKPLAGANIEALDAFLRGRGYHA